MFKYKNKCKYISLNTLLKLVELVELRPLINNLSIFIKQLKQNNIENDQYLKTLS